MTSVLCSHPSAHFRGCSPQQCPCSTTCLWVSSSTSTVLHSLYMLKKTFLFNIYMSLNFKEDDSRTYQPIGPIVSALVFPRFASLRSSSIAFLVGKRKKFERILVTPLNSENQFVPRMWPWERKSFWSIKLQNWGRNLKKCFKMVDSFEYIKIKKKPFPYRGRTLKRKLKAKWRIISTLKTFKRTVILRNTN